MSQSDQEMQILAERGEAALAHFGKKGMKWGVRNDAKRSSTTKTKQSKTVSVLKKADNAIEKTSNGVSFVRGAAFLGGVGYIYVKTMLGDPAYADMTSTDLDITTDPSIPGYDPWKDPNLTYEEAYEQTSGDRSTYNPDATLDPSRVEDRS